MNTEERREAIKMIVQELQEDLLAKAEQFPEDWDGFELRQLVSDAALQACRPMTRLRLRTYYLVLRRLGISGGGV